VLAWQRRPLEALYPVNYLDALVVKVKDGTSVRNEAAHIAAGWTQDVTAACTGSGWTLRGCSGQRSGFHRPRVAV
jgi:transposase-like protein